MIRRAILGLCFLPALVYANGNNTHSTIFDQELVGGGIVSDGYGFAQRFGATGFGTIVINQVPVGAQVVQAYLYWVMVAGYDDTVEINGDIYTGTLIGTTWDTCWSWGDNHVYRAEVVDTVSANGTYDVTGFSYQAGTIDSQGFSIVVIYQDISSPDLTRVAINDGAIWGGGGGMHGVTNSTVNFGGPVGTGINRVRAHYVVGDTQGATDGNTLFNGAVIATNNFEGDGCPSPGGCANPIPGGDGAMWDDDTFDLTANNLVSPGATSVTGTIGSGSSSDCLVFAALGVEISYPNPCPDQDLDLVTTCDGDCNDLDYYVNPNAPEVENGVDDNCDGIIDNTPAYEDSDGDGWSPAEGDCDDTDPASYPGAEDIPYDGIDQDCSGIDEADLDGDGYLGGTFGVDCDDSDADVHPNAVELCEGGVDEDCDGEVDEDECGTSSNPNEYSQGQGCACSAGKRVQVPLTLFLALMCLGAIRRRRTFNPGADQ